MASERRRLGTPEDRKLSAEAELGWQMIERAVADGLPFELVAFDDNYGKRSRLRSNLTKPIVRWRRQPRARTSGPSSIVGCSLTTTQSA